MVCKTSYYIVFVYNYCTSIGVSRDKLDVKVYWDLFRFTSGDKRSIAAGFTLVECVAARFISIKIHYQFYI